MNKQLLPLITNAILLIAEVIGFILVLTEYGLGCLVYYTQESNIILLIASILCVVAYTRAYKNNTPVPHYVGVVKYIAACTVTVTFVVVLTVLAPTRASQGADAVLKVIMGGSNFFHHLLCPILGVVSWLLIDTKTTIKFKTVLLASAATLVYAIVTIILNVLRVLEGPYVFLYVYKQPLYMSVFWFFAIVGGGFLFALLLRFIYKITLGTVHLATEVSPGRELKDREL